MADTFDICDFKNTKTWPTHRLLSFKNDIEEAMEHDKRLIQEIKDELASRSGVSSP